MAETLTITRLGVTGSLKHTNRSSTTWLSSSTGRLSLAKKLM